MTVERHRTARTEERTLALLKGGKVDRGGIGPGWGRKGERLRNKEENLLDRA